MPFLPLSPVPPDTKELAQRKTFNRLSLLMNPRKSILFVLQLAGVCAPIIVTGLNSAPWGFFCSSPLSKLCGKSFLSLSLSLFLSFSSVVSTIRKGGWIMWHTFYFQQACYSSAEFFMSASVTCSRSSGGFSTTKRWINLALTSHLAPGDRDSQEAAGNLKNKGKKMLIWDIHCDAWKAEHVLLYGHGFWDTCLWLA